MHGNIWYVFSVLILLLTSSSFPILIFPLSQFSHSWFILFAALNIFLQEDCFKISLLTGKESEFKLIIITWYQPPNLNNFTFNIYICVYVCVCVCVCVCISGVGNGNLLQYSSLKNPWREAWQVSLSITSMVSLSIESERCGHDSNWAYKYIYVCTHKYVCIAL